LENIIKYPEIYTEWSVNEKVALEVCASIGISIIPILWIQTDKSRLKTDKISPHPCPLPVLAGRG